MKCSNCGKEIPWEVVNSNLSLASDCSFVGADHICECGEELEIYFVLNEGTGRNWEF